MKEKMYGGRKEESERGLIMNTKMDNRRKISEIIN